MSTDELMNRLEKLSGRELLVDATIRYLFSFTAEVADAAFRCAILRWFNADTLEGVLGTAAISGIESFPQEGRMSPEDLDEQLRKLRFAEEYHDRGHSFHDRTRNLILDYLWHKQLDFYRQVSVKAVEHFRGLLNTQIERRERREIDSSEVDQDLIVEIAYHYFIADERGAVKAIDMHLDFLLQQRALGTYHAVIHAASEHAKADRISSDSKLWIEMWRLKEVHANNDIAQAESIALQILQSPHAGSDSVLKAGATFLLADTLLMASRYGEAKKYFEENMRQCEKLENPSGAVNALIGLGNVEFQTENYRTAQDYFADALFYCVQQLRVPPPEESEFGENTPLRVFVPEAWQRRESYPLEETEDQEKAPPPTNGGEAISQVRVLYSIEFNTEELGIDTSNLSEDDALRYEWPIEPDNVLASLWLKLGYLNHALDRYDVAASCARLAGQLSIDLDDLSGAQQAVQFLQVLGANLGDLEYVKSMKEFQHELLSRAVALKDERAELLGLINQASAQFSVDKYEEARQTYQKAYSLAESLNLTNEKATCLDGLARLDWTNADYDLAVKGFDSALDLYKEAHNREGEADTLLSLGDLYAARKSADAEQWYLRALDTYEELKTFSGEWKCRLKLAEAATSKGDYEGSFAHFDQMLELSRKNHRLSSEAETLSKIAVLHLSLGNNDQAEEAFHNALDIANRIGNKQLISVTLLDGASVHIDLAEYSSAVKLYDQVIEVDPGSLQVHSDKGWALNCLGKAPDARQALEKAIDLRPNYWWGHKEIANALLKSGDLKSAIVKYEWVVDQIEKEGVTPAVGPTLGWCLYQLGQYEKAEKIFQQVISSDPDPISDYFDLGLVLLCHGQYSEALLAYQKGIGLLRQRFPRRRTLGLIFVAIDDLRQAIDRHAKLSEVAECNMVQDLLKREEELASENSEGKRIISATL